MSFTLLLAFAALAQNPTPAPKEEAFNPRPFRIRDTHAALWQIDEVNGHIAARRFGEAIDGLQTVLEDHASDVLGPERARLANGQRASQPTHYGAATRARTLLFQLPVDARALYRERFELRARTALASAVRKHDRRALWEVTRRWPLTPSAQRAAWAVGDLEWEQGHAEEALAGWSHALGLALDTPDLVLADARAWDAALARLAERGAEANVDPASAARRVEAARAWMSGRASGTAGAARTTRPPGRDADAWFEPAVLPTSPFGRGPRLFGTREDALVFVSTSLRLLALDAYSGTPAWRSEEPRGWAELGSQRNKFFRGIDATNALIQPAASERVVVAALQVPVTFIDNQDFQTVGITTIIPDRRLFAFDSKSGTPLWDHYPPPDWDGDSGGFVERMSLAGPPVIAERRVLAPCYRMQGRIDYHVGCFDLDTGELLWSTDVISGQRELNMFGRPEKEFCAPPLVVSGDRVIAATQLGAVACLDLYSGEVRWVTLYDQIPLPRSRDLQAPTRVSPWRNQPPVVTGSTIVATPFDSWGLLGLDLESGRLLWSIDNQPSGTIGTLAELPGARIDQLVGARDDTVYLAGETVLALRAPAGLGLAAPNSRKWKFEDQTLQHGGARGTCVLAGDRIVVPGDERCLSIDVASGHLTDEGVAWGSGAESGNVLVGERELFCISNRRVSGYFEWGVLVQRARRAVSEHPEDPRAALRLGRLLGNRGTLELERRGKSQDAREALTEARRVLEGGLGRGAESARKELEAELHRVLRAQARALISLADPREARSALARARELAPTDEDLRDTLLEELALLRQRANEDVAVAKEREALLIELEKRAGELTLFCDPAPGEASANTLSAEEAPFVFEPIVGGVARATLVPVELPVALWTLFTRQRDAMRARDTTREFAHLHTILDTWADVPLIDTTAGERASARLGELVRSGRTQGWAPFTERAAAELAAARAAKDRERLLTVTRRFPHSPAAIEANDARLDWAQEDGDLAEVARVVQSELPYRWIIHEAGEREFDLCLRLALAARTAGNSELEAGLLRRLASVKPGHVSRRPEHGGQSLAALGAPEQRSKPEHGRLLPETGRFSLEARSDRELLLQGEYELIARTLPQSAEDGPGDLLAGLVVPYAAGRQRGSALHALEPQNGRPRWTREFPAGSGPIETSAPWTRRVVVARGRVVVACPDALLGLDERTGETRWTWTVPARDSKRLVLHARSGVVVVAHETESGPTLHAVDAWSGAELWEARDLGAEHALDPLVSEQGVVSLPNVGKRGVVVRDLFTGRKQCTFELEIAASQSISSEAWIDGERLIVPRFQETRTTAANQIAAHALDDGARKWRILFHEMSGEPRALKSVVQAEDRTYLVLQAQPGAKVQNFPTGLYELSTGIGALAPIQNVRIASEDRIVGMPQRGARGLFANSTILVLSPSSGEGTLVRAIDLERGEIWSQSLGVRWERLIQRTLPRPAWSDRAVALCFEQRIDAREKGTQQHTYLAFFDLGTGVLRETRLMEDRWTDRADSVVLYPLGETLMVRGKSRVEVLR